MGFPPCLRSFLAQICQANSAEIALGGGKKSDAFSITIGTKQGCPLSPTILNLILDPIICSVKGDSQILGYVDDLCLISYNREAFIRDSTKLAELLYQAKFELGVDRQGKSKTAAMTNCPSLKELKITARDRFSLQIGRPEQITYDIQSYGRKNHTST